MESPVSSAVPNAYAAARAVAPVVRDHFARQLQAARQRGEADAGLLPDAAAIEVLIDAAFWASLRREEGATPKISLAFLPPEATSHPLLFERPLPLSATALTRLGPAVERPSIHLGVWSAGGTLLVWGTTLTVPRSCLVVEVVAPGLLVVKHRRGESGKFQNVAVLEGDQIKVVDEEAPQLPGCPDVLTTRLGFAAPTSWGDAMNVLVQLAVSMRAHGRGGSMLMVPAGRETWRESIGPHPYAVSPPFTELADILRQMDAGGEVHGQPDLDRAVDAVAGLTAVDGATVITDRYELLAFGTTIVPRNGSRPVEKVIETEPIDGFVPVVVHPSELGGTRHLSAAQFVQDQPDAIALVASQDGRFTVFAWSPCEDMVHAHRIETLLL
jgi:hypothetical protein